MGTTRTGRCDAKCHLRCVDLAAVPDGDWFCSSCVSERTLPLSLASSGGGGGCANKVCWSMTFCELSRCGVWHFCDRVGMEYDIFTDGTPVSVWGRDVFRDVLFCKRFSLN